MKSYKLLLPFILFLAFLLPRMLSAQNEVTYTGQITAGDSGEPLIGVNILILRTGSGTQTDFDGNYELNARLGDSIQISYIGYDPIQYQLGAETQINFTMETGNQMLEEIVVVGYGTQKQKDLTSSITTVSSEEIM